LKRRLTETLVKSILIETVEKDGNRYPSAHVIYRFEGQDSHAKISIANHKDVRVAFLAIRVALACVRQHKFGGT
jgi:hypothetical protein